MDWEKKTVKREALSGAAADNFNEMLTPAQTLLQTLQESEVARKEKYYSTVSAKMKAAREKLPSLGVKHAPRSDTSIFTVPPPREVHSLLPDIRPEKANMEGVRQMLGQQFERHRAVWETFVGVRDGTQQQLEDEVCSIAADLKGRLESDDTDIEDIMSMLKEDRVMRLTEPEVYQVWEAVAQRVPERARWIEVLGASLEEAEERRRTTVEGQLVKMVGPWDIFQEVEER
ncbi:hypothetical protein DUNSADRAFT_4137 [Dunaliella salina]|uniref:DUF4455 domain-containing protein n=1 Tax=Dunaliella salina TaxID=3046 RepID=A0ABQ7FUZ6_DUNSA|nr:hypothetical protein DUNSADRAFT_4137 [Dunaliella salina]|eukprot:KAF5826213.1 hypothetical protein DUNSADRAFT_4137 [Dunaliella salina]